MCFSSRLRTTAKLCALLVVYLGVLALTMTAVFACAAWQL